MVTFEDKGIKTKPGKVRYATTCPICDSKREKHRGALCLTVNDEPGNRWFKCHHCGYSGNLDVMDHYDRVHKESHMPSQERQMTMKVRAYIEGRGFSIATMKKCRVYEMTRGGEAFVCFPFFMNLTLVNVKFRNIEWTPGSKSPKIFQLPQSLGTRIIPWNLQNVSFDDPDNKKEPKIVIITEGEWDTMTWVECGYNNTISVPQGAPSVNAKVFTKEFAWLEDKFVKSVFADVDLFYLSVDEDEPGRLLRRHLAMLLGKDKCRIIQYPPGYKDINEVLAGNRNKNLPSMGKQGVIDCYNNISSVPVAGVIKPYMVRDDLDKIRVNGFLPGLGCGIPEVDRLFTVKPKHITFVTGVPGAGKALDINTDIPTPTGFKKMGDLKVGDKVFDETGNPCNVIKATEIMYNHNCYKMTFSDNSEIIADEDHLWETDTWKSRRSEANAKKNSKSSNYYLKNRGTDQRHKRTYATIKTTKKIAETIRLKNDDRVNHSIKLANAVQHDEVLLPLDPYVLGAWLGDGSSYHSLFTSADKEIINYIKSKGYTVTKTAAKYGYTIHGIYGFIRRENLYRNKHIPLMYQLSSIEQRKELLRGLMDTDGTIDSKNQQAMFTSISKKLAINVYELVCSLGLKATFKESDAKLHGVIISKNYKIAFKPTFSVFNLQRKAELQKFYNNPRDKYRYVTKCEKICSVPVKCIEVDSDSKLFLCGKQHIPTHNSVWVRWWLTEMVRYNEKEKLRWAMFTPENRPVAREFAKIAEAATGLNIRNDLGENSMSEEVYRAAMRFVEKHFFVISPDRKNFERWDGDKSRADKINTLDNILKYLEYLKKTENIFGYVIDAWNKIEHEQPKWQQETTFISEQLDRLITFNDYWDLHGIIIVHPRKIEQIGENYKMPSLYDIKGSSAWKEKADIGILIHRYKMKKISGEAAQRQGLSLGDMDEDEKWYVVPNAPTIIRTEKIRFEETGVEDRVRMIMKTGGRFVVDKSKKQFIPLKDDEFKEEDKRQKNVPTPRPTIQFYEKDDDDTLPF